RQPVRGAELRHRRGADDGGGQARRAAHAGVRDHRTAPRQEARRPIGDGGAHGGPRPRGGRARARPDPLRTPARARSAPGGPLRRPRPNAVDPPRLDLPRVLHARSAAGNPEGGNAGAAADGRARTPALAPPGGEKPTLFTFATTWV